MSVGRAHAHTHLPNARRRPQHPHHQRHHRRTDPRANTGPLGLPTRGVPCGRPKKKPEPKTRVRTIPTS
jgi:hypothetical protein